MKVHAKDGTKFLCGVAKPLRAINFVMFWHIDPRDRCKRCQNVQWPSPGLAGGEGKP